MSRALCLTLASLVSVPAFAADWPQWRGPDRDGRSPDTGLLQRWPEGGPPKVLSASGFGSGYSSLAIVGERIFTLGDHGEDQFLIAAERSTGKVVWSTRIGAAWKDQFAGPRGTPTVSGGRVVALGTDGDLVCASVADGRILWRRNLAKDFGGHPMVVPSNGYDWRFAESPLVDGDRVIVTPGGPEAALVALALADGKEIWRAKLPALGERGADGAGYSSIVVSNGGGIRQYVQLMGRGVVGIEAASGRFLWGYNRIANDVANIPTPLVRGDDVFVSTGYGTGTARLRLVRAGDGVKVEEVWFNAATVAQNHHGNMILDGEHLYLGHGHNRGYPLALRTADGTPAWGPIETDGRNSAALVWADGKLVFRYQDGLMLMVAADPSEYRALGSFMIPDVEQASWSHPVVIDGMLYLREQDALHVYDLRAKKPAAAPAKPAG